MDISNPTTPLYEITTDASTSLFVRNLEDKIKHNSLLIKSHQSLEFTYNDSKSDKSLLYKNGKYFFKFEDTNTDVVILNDIKLTITTGGVSLILDT